VAPVRPLTVRWTARARLQLLSIRDYVATRNLAAAERIGQTLKAAVELLKDLPNAGRAGTAEGTREWVVRGMPYIIVYELREEIGELHVLGVFHQRQKRPSVK
jgi:toxin ParE1/3/4